MSLEVLEYAIFQTACTYGKENPYFAIIADLL